MATTAGRSHGPVLEFETLLAQFVDRAQELIASQSRLRDLIRVNHDLTSNLDLPSVLRHIVEIATELLHARYGAMGIIGQGTRLEQFIHVGVDDETAARIGRPPEGTGLLGAIIDEANPVRLESIGDYGSSSGFPDEHPPMTSFLGVPIRVRDEIFGNLYLTDSLNGRFSTDDEELAQALADTAGIAITNARLFEDSRYRERWASALAETSRSLMKDDHEADRHREILVDRVREIADADLVSILLLQADGSRFVVDRASGLGADQLPGLSFDPEGSLSGQALREGRPVMVSDVGALDDHGFEEQALLVHAMVVPFSIADSPAGVLTMARAKGRPPFSARDLEMGASFAAHVSVAIDRSAAHEARQRVALLEDRSRIARDLHDHVIQRLFAAGLSLQAVAAGVRDDGLANRIAAQIGEIDGAITQIRQSIFSMRSVAENATVGLRARVLEIVDRISDRFHSRPRVIFDGPVDLMADAELADDVSAVVNEALTNAVKHADAKTVEVTVSAASGQMTVEVVDDGAGPVDVGRLGGLANLRERAEARNGTLQFGGRDEGGTRLLWSVPG